MKRRRQILSMLLSVSMLGCTVPVSAQDDITAVFSAAEENLGDSGNEKNTETADTDLTDIQEFSDGETAADDWDEGYDFGDSDSEEDKEGTIGDNIHWEYSQGVLTFSGQGAIAESDSYGWYEWSSCEVTSVVIKEGITSLPRYFLSRSSCSENITSVSIPLSVTEIGQEAFQENSQLDSVIYPGNDQQWNSINIHASNFYLLRAKPQTSGKCGAQAYWSYADGKLTITGSGAVDDYEEDYYAQEAIYHQPWSPYVEEITEVEIGNGITSLGNYAFKDHEALKKVVLADSVEIIGEYCFQQCQELNTVIMSAGTHSIGRLAFESCFNLETVDYNGSADFWNEVSIGGGNRYLQNVFPQTRGKLTDTISWTLKDGVLTISGSGSLPSGSDYDTELPFENTFTELVIGEGITVISGHYFQGQDEIRKVTLPKSLTEIQEGAFSHCSNFLTVEYDGTEEDWNNIAIGNGNSSLFYVRPQTRGTIADGFSYTLKDGKLTISGSGEMPESITMDEYTWTEICMQADTLEFSDGITAVYVRVTTQTLKKVILGKDVQKIGEGAFYGCAALTDIRIPVSVTEIGENAFAGCKKLHAVYEGTQEQWSNVSVGSGNAYLLSSISGDQTVIVESGTCGPDLFWKLDTDGVLTIYGTGDMTSSPWTYKYDSQYTSVIIESGCTSIKGDAFWSADGGKNFFIPKTVTGIGEYALFSKSERNTVNYEGTLAEWKKIRLGGGNDNNNFNYEVERIKGVKALKELIRTAGNIREEDCLNGWNQLQEALRSAEAELASGSYTEETIARETQTLKTVLETIEYTAPWYIELMQKSRSRSYGSDPFTLPVETEAPSSSLKYKSSDEKVAVVSSDGKVTVKKTGTVKITITAEADKTHREASVIYTLKVIKGDTSLSITAKPSTYNGKAFNSNNLKVTVKGSSGKRTCTYYTDSKCKIPTVKSNSGASQKGGAPVYAGTYYVKYSVAADAGFNSVSSQPVKITIKKATPVITAKTASKTVSYSKVKKTKQTFKLNASATGKNAVIFQKISGSSKITVSRTGTVTVPAKTKKGTYSIKVKLSTKSGSNYNAARSKTITVKVIVK